MIRRAFDRLCGILARDCDGRPLRAGDRAEPLKIGDTVPRHLRRPVVTVTGPCWRGEPGCVSVDVIHPEAEKPYTTRGANLRRIDDSPADWSAIETATGWCPTATHDDKVTA